MRVLPPLTAAVLVATLAPTPPASAAPARAVEAITLITGDRVTVAPDRPVRLDPGPGRRNVAYRTTVEDGHTFVVPADQEPTIASGRVDRRLFDVTALEEFGYRGNTPVLVQNGRSVSPVGNGAAALAAAKAGTRIWLDGKRAVSLDRSVPQIGAPVAWAAGYTGAGVKVAVLDSGVDATHPDLAGRIAESADLTGGSDADDKVGHGTHVASTIASDGATYRGVAPDARLLIGKVCPDRYCPDSAILAGVDWAATRGAKIVNLSLGGADSPGLDPLEQAVERYSAEKGMLFVVAAGNDGPYESTVSSPASADAALAVAAVDRDGQPAAFSSRGPRADGGAIKPEISAPGVGIAAAKAAHGTLGTPVDDTHVAMSGTSMATPHAAGAAALLAQQHPDWTGERIKAALMASAEPTAGVPVLTQGAGRVDLARAIHTRVVASPVGLSFGTQRWPHTDDKPIERTVTYANAGPDAVTLDLTIDSPAPAGAFTVTPSRVTIEPGATAGVRVEADTGALGATYGRVDGAVVAASGDTRVRTPFEILNEAEAYDLSVQILDTDGAPARSLFTSFARKDAYQYQTHPRPDENGVVQLRLPRGRYAMVASVFGADSSADLWLPEINADHDQELTLDAREASPIDVRPVGDDGVTEALGGYSVENRSAQGWGMSYSFSACCGGFTTFAHRVGVAGPPPAKGELWGYLMSTWTTAPGAADARVYPLGSYFTDRLPTGWTRHVDVTTLAESEVTPPAVEPGNAYLQWAFVYSARRREQGAGQGVELTGATRVRTFFPARADGLLGAYRFDERTPTYANRWTAASPPIGRRLGTVERLAPWRPVYGPALTAVGEGADLARYADDTVAAPARYALFGDSAGNVGWIPAGSYATTMSRLDVPGEIAADANGRFPLPPEPGRYRLAMTGTAPAGFTSSTRVEATWEFTSAHSDAARTLLPLSAPHFEPRLDAGGGAPGGQRFTVPVSVRSYPGAGETRRIAAEISYDDGATWTAAPVKGRRITLRHPAGPGHVSLRATVTDSHGNTGTVTILRAYDLNG
ncbi:S8 family serine peptidase [Actinoplanes sp. NPDC089786]|uniref:S8 family serine peptidase n=1 Tax=Actinoplanes sp. NPDC089786 TaxID=3155185 RepID=UPI00341AE572